MIYLYYGKIGDGKTYHVVQNELLPAVKSGRKVYTNIDGLNIRRIAQYLNMPITDVNIELVPSDKFRDMLTCNADDPEGISLKIDKNSLIIVDEAQKIWDARSFKDTRKEFLNFLEYHRHYGFDLVFITQNPKRLESVITRLSNEAYQVKNLKFLGSFLGRRYVLHIRQSPGDRDIIATMRGVLKDEIFALYRSYVTTNKTNRVSKTALSSARSFIFFGLILLPIVLFVGRGGLTILDPEKNANMVKQDVEFAEAKGVENHAVVYSQVSDNHSHSSISTHPVALAEQKTAVDIINHASIEHTNIKIEHANIKDVRQQCIKVSEIEITGFYAYHMLDYECPDNYIVRFIDGVYVSKRLRKSDAAVALPVASLF